MLHSDPSVVDNATAEVQSVWNFKIPVFWRSNPELWFKQISFNFLRPTPPSIIM